MKKSMRRKRKILKAEEGQDGEKDPADLIPLLP